MKTTWQIELCSKKDTPIDEVSTLPTFEPEAVTEDSVKPQRRPEQLAGTIGVVNRLSPHHEIVAYPNAGDNEGAYDISPYVQSVTISMEVNKDITATVTLNDVNLTLSSLILFSIGHRLGIKLFDGKTWIDYGSFIIVNPDRNYESSSVISLDCRSERAKLQRNMQSHKWENVKRSNVIKDLARSYGYAYDVDETSLVIPAIVMSQESVTAFIQRMAVQEGYWWKFEDDKIFFKKREPEHTGVILKYRPPYPEIGSVISARSSVDGANANGDKALPKARSIDFGSGKLDNSLIGDIARRNIEGYGPNVVTQIGQVLYNPRNYSLLTALQQPGEPDHDISDSGNVFDGPVEYAPPSAGFRNKTKEEIEHLRNTLYVSNAIGKYQLALVTFGQAELKLERIITVEGLSPEDDGNWFINKLDINYDGSFLMTLGCERHKRPAGSKIPSKSFLGQLGLDKENSRRKKLNLEDLKDL